MIGPDWGVYGFNLHPLEPRTGIFPEKPYLETWWKHRGANQELLIASSDIGLVPFVFDDGTVRIAGDGDVTDYHSPLGAGLPSLIEELAASVPAGTSFDFDSLPGRASSGLADALLDNGFTPQGEVHEVAAVLELPETMDDYMMQRLSKKERHETRRKIRRFEAALGTPRIVAMEGDDAVALFASMHRLSSGDKGVFMTEAMEDYFKALHRDAGFTLDALVGEDGTPVAMGFGFKDAEVFYLYNSAYEPEHRDASPGVVLLNGLIEQTIEEGRPVFDFLKGDETYKFRLGATERPLCRLTGTFHRP